ncbi:hypothetical protein ABPG73_015511, partial [Tetrahymena malaccensis]
MQIEKLLLKPKGFLLNSSTIRFNPQELECLNQSKSKQNNNAKQSQDNQSCQTENMRKNRTDEDFVFTFKKFKLIENQKILGGGGSCCSKNKANQVFSSVEVLNQRQENSIYQENLNNQSIYCVQANKLEYSQIQNLKQDPNFKVESQEENIKNEDLNNQQDINMKQTSIQDLHLVQNTKSEQVKDNKNLKEKNK